MQPPYTLIYITLHFLRFPPPPPFLKNWQRVQRVQRVQLQAHIDDAGFPGVFPVECCNLNGDERGIIGQGPLRLALFFLRRFNSRRLLSVSGGASRRGLFSE